MDIINKISEQKFYEIDDLLAFISIYDDVRRTDFFIELLENHKSLIKNKVCVEIGTGMGILSEKMALLGAKKVYALEKNKYLYELAKKRIGNLSNVEVLNIDAKDFEPQEQVDVLVYELFGQMLLDEDVFVLEQLKFKPKYFLPQKAQLMVGTANVEDFEDEFVNLDFLKKLDGVLISGLFDEEDLPLQKTILEFDATKKIPLSTIVDISELEGNLLYFGIKIADGKNECISGVCDNWSYVWTYRKANKFKLSFEKNERDTDVIFEWL